MKAAVFTVVLLFLFTISIMAQQPEKVSYGPNYLESNPNVTTYQTNDRGIPRFVEGNLSDPAKSDDITATAFDFFENNRGAYKMANPTEELMVGKIEEDDLGMRHIRFNQTYKGVKVIGGELFAHFTADNILKTVNGTYIDRINIDVRPDLAQEEAVRLASDDLSGFFGAGQPGSPELVVFPWEGQNYLCWRLFILSDTPMGRWEYLVDAKTGDIVFKANRIMDVDVWGTGIGVMGQARNWLDISNTGGTYYMIDYTRRLNNNVHGHGGQMPSGNYIQTNIAGSSLPGSVATDADNYWDNATTQRPAVDGHTYTGLMYDYMLSQFNRNGYNGNGASMLTSVNYSAEGDNNAYWNGSQIVIWSWSTGWRSLAGCPDVIAHEWGHAITEYTSGLVYQKEPGALNESFSDMIGAAFEFAHDTLDTPDWLMGENGRTTGVGFRSMSDPHVYGDPDYYGTSDPYWVNVVGCTPSWYNDYCGVHTNSGVGNKWFFLLSDGGIHHGITVSGIGVQNAMKIAYRANAYYWNSQTDYHEAALGTISAAMDLDPSGAWALQVSKAWNAVGVTTPGPSLAFSYPEGIPETVMPGAITTFPVVVTGILGGEAISGSGQLHYSINGGAYIVESMTQTGIDEYEASLPAISCGDQLQFYVSAEEATYGIFYDPDPSSPNVANAATQVTTVLYDDFETNQGWTVSGGLWNRGVPTGSGGQYGGPDPSSGTIGPNVYGYNLNGDYENSLPERHLTSPVLDCSGLSNLKLSFWRWLGVEQPSYDHAYIRISTNGTTWTTLWENTAEVADQQWVFMEFDISQYADNQPTVYLRWTMGTTDGSWQYCGWNIDGVEVTGYTCDENALVITTDDLPDWTVKRTYSQQLEASGGIGVKTWNDRDGDLAGTGLSLATDGIISGMPMDVGTISFIARAVDEELHTADKPFTFNINAALSITTFSLPNWTIEIPYSQQLGVKGGTGTKTWIDKNNDLSGTGLTLSNSGLLSGSVINPGPISFTAMVSDIAGDTEERVFNITANPHVVITTDSVPSGLNEVEYSCQLESTGGTSPLSWTDKNGDLAGSGMSLSTGGLISGMPAASGDYPFTAMVVDAVGDVSEKPFTITIISVLAIITTDVPDWTAGYPYSIQLEVVGGVGAKTWSDKNNDLDGTGLSLSPTGLLSGTPTAVMEITFTAMVVDESKMTDEKTFSITINPALEITSDSFPDWTVNVPYTQQLLTAGGTGNIVWHDKNGNLASTGILLSAEGILYGTPVQVGLISFTAKATDQGGAAVEKQFSFTINPGIMIITSELPEVTVNMPCSHQLDGDGGTGTLTWADKYGNLSGSGVSLSADGLLSGTPTSAGSTGFIARVVDEVGAFNELSLTLVVNEAVSISTEQLPDWTINRDYSQQLASSGGTGSISWMDKDSDLEGTGLSLSASGLLAGIPTSTEPISFTALAADESGSSAEMVLGLNINESVSITTTSLPSATVELPYTFQLEASGGTGGKIWSDMTGALDGSGLTLSSDGLLTGTPLAVSDIEITVEAEDICGSMDEVVFTLSIRPAYVCGDADGNESVNILDVSFLIAYIYRGGPAPDPIESADADAGGSLNILDVTYIIAYLYKDGPAPVCP